MIWQTLSADEDRLVWRWRALGKTFPRIAQLLRRRRAQIVGKRRQWAKIYREQVRQERKA